MFLNVSTLGSKLCFAKVKSRKSFVSLIRSEVPLSTPKKEVAKKKTAKSTARKRRVKHEESSEESLEPIRKKNSPQMLDSYVK